MTYIVNKTTGQPTPRPTDIDPLTAMDQEFSRIYDGISSLPGDMADIDLIDRNLSRGLIRPDEPLPGWVVWGMILAVAMACVFVGVAWADPVGWAVNLSN